jgi:hypothetical protein
MTTVVAPNRSTLSTLAEWQGSPLVSAFVPVDFSRPQARHAATRAVRHVAQMAAARLTAEHDMDPGGAAIFVAPMIDGALLDGVPLSSRGLAMFVSSEHCEAMPLPLAVGPAVETGDRLDLLRLLPMLCGNFQFYTVTIDQKGAHVYHGDRFEFAPVHIDALPGSIEDTLWYIRREPILNRHGSGVIHGAGGGQDLRKDDVRQFIHLIDKAVTTELDGSEAPLVVVGVDYEAAMFINHTRYRHAVKPAVLGSPDSMPIAEIHRRSWELVRAQDDAGAAVLRQFYKLAGTGKTAIAPNDIVAASEQGVVRQLLVAASATDGGQTPALTAAERHTIVLAVNQALMHKADIHIVDDASMPDGARVGAVLRY